LNKKNTLTIIEKITSKNEFNERLEAKRKRPEKENPMNLVGIFSTFNSIKVAKEQYICFFFT